MAKTRSLDTIDLKPQPSAAKASRLKSVDTASSLLQLKLTPELAKTFKLAALQNDMKFNQFFKHCLELYLKSK